MKISDFNVGGKKVFVIAEIGNNHNGSIELALEMVDAAHEAGANCVKFQMRNMSSVYRKKSLDKQGEDLGTEYVLDLLERIQLSEDEHRKVAQYCDSKGILYMCTPWDSDSILALEALDIQAYKVASADLTNLPLIENLIATKKPLILSTGMSSVEEIQITTNFLNSRNADFVLLHCNSTYPAPFSDINLNWIKKLENIHPLIGYSGHERGTAVTLAAVGLGAKVVERHFTFDRCMEGPDHAASLERDEFKALVNGIREIEEALGEGLKKNISQGEMINRENLAKSLVASIDLVKGTVIEPQHLKVVSPGQGLSAQNYEKLLGRKVQRDMLEEEYFYPSDLQDKRVEPRSYKFNRPWGVPVRYHDFEEYKAKINPDIFEFHLSYSDLDLNIEEFLYEEYHCDFVVHAPELLSGSRLMDLASPDDDYRQYSVRETQKVIEITRSLKKYFPNTERPMIVANVGGFTMDEHLPSAQLNSYYERFSNSLALLNLDGVELIPQTMAPFPWHFGGQRYQNLFVHADECRHWCEKLNLRMCFDISHSRLMSNHFGVDFYEFAEKITPITGHLHLGDASGTNGEGLQIGDGDIDFERLSLILAEGCPEAPFIPEIWQGHKNGGEGFWIALERLESII
ncbi:MAG: acetylneuraminic acid synthetase [Crocinitomicaceae bacterium]|nr:acetylneuraminic acid synthetase [Crocinitomicaceae bacterium]